MSVPKRQHYIPKAILKNFCFSADTLYYFSKEEPEKGVQERNIKSVFQKRHLNTLELGDGKRDFGLEEFFGREFDNFVPHFNSVFASYFDKQRLKLSGDERRRFIQFFYNHMKRTPDFHQPAVDKVSANAWFEESIQEYERQVRPLSDEEVERISDRNTRERIVNQGRVKSLAAQTGYILNMLASKHIVVAKPFSSKKQFIVASNPVARFIDHPDANLESGPLELWTSFGPQLAVGLSDRRPKSDFILLDNNSMRKMNLHLVKNSSCFAAANRELVYSLAHPK